MKEAGYRGKYSFLRLILGDMKDLHGGLIHKLVFDAQSFQGTFSMGKQNNGHFSLFVVLVLFLIILLFVQYPSNTMVRAQLDSKGP